jgi:hypothetical protein
MTGMYQRALIKWSLESFAKDISVPAVWKITASTLAKQFRDTLGVTTALGLGDRGPLAERSVIQVVLGACQRYACGAT